MLRDNNTCRVETFYSNCPTGSLKFVIDPTDYAKGPHTVVVTATNLLGETDTYTFTFGMNGPSMIYTVPYSNPSANSTVYRILAPHHTLFSFPLHHTLLKANTVQFYCYHVSPDAVETEAVSVWKDREFVAAIAIAGVAFIILLLLLLAICLLVFYHRKVNRLKLYGLGECLYTKE